MTVDANFWAAVAAIAQSATVIVAVLAAIYARGQVREARETRERVAQPEIVVFVDHHQIRRYVDLVIKNFGQTTAYNIQITLPDLQVARYKSRATDEEVTHLLMPRAIAVLAPGQEWRTVWDSAVRRENFEGTLQDQYVGRVDFDDRVDGPGKRSYSNPIILDVKMFWNTMWIERKKGRSIENALYDIAETLENYKDEHDGIWVYTVPGDEERQYRKRLEDDPEFAFDEFMDKAKREERRQP
ncbi:hypothetical protein [Mycolicibacterium bacteremicum]|uniref:hypothetical protein n=1 Tax=Mycolicibacterium bacteremicum TaxID=564198 RepID=UPI001F47126E|nr:hypothetical protein [Mycolicibacterium bacteremicum]